LVKPEAFEVGDTRKDFSEFYPGTGRPVPAPGVEVEDAYARERLNALAAAVGAITDLDPDGPESVADVKEQLNAVKDAVASV
jgi:hypothetical protein